MRVNFAAQLRAAKAVERAVHAVSPKTQVGLMNSGEPAHSVQGRDMDALLRAFSGGGNAFPARWAEHTATRCTPTPWKCLRACL